MEYKVFKRKYKEVNGKTVQNDPRRDAANYASRYSFDFVTITESTEDGELSVTVWYK